MSKSQHHPRTPPQIVEAIERQATVVRNAVAELTERIQKFEQFLNALPGRGETWHFVPHPNRDGPEDDAEFVIRLHREGNVWILSWKNNNPINFEHSIKWQPLKDAPLKIKIAAVNAFPDFLEEIEQTQAKLAKKIQEATVAYDEFVKTLEKRSSVPQNEGGGGREPANTPR